MGIAVECRFDVQSEEYVRGLWASLQQQLGEDIQDTGVSPHLCLGEWEAADPPGEEITSRMREILQKFSREIHSFALTFPCIGLFPGNEGILFCAPVFTQDLWNAHVYLHRHSSELRQSAHSHCLPNCWTPHCVLAKGLSASERIKALAILCQKYRPFTARIQSICLVSTAQPREHLALPLSGL